MKREFAMGGEELEKRNLPDLLTMYDGRLNLTQQVVTEIKKFFPNKVYKTTIPRNVRLSEAPSYGEPIIYFDKNSKGAIAYMEFAEEFLSNIRFYIAFFLSFSS